jgi:hypothetical protein
MNLSVYKTEKLIMLKADFFTELKRKREKGVKKPEQTTA